MIAQREATEADHRNMMEQLGIKALRPGPSGNEQAPNHANYDEALANPYPNLPEVLTLKNGRKVTTRRDVVEQRRPEIVEDFDREVLGRVPKNVPKVTWTVDRGRSSPRSAAGRSSAGSSSATWTTRRYPAITVDIQMTLVTPADAKTPVPVMMMFGGGRTLPGDPPPAARGRHAGASLRRRRPIRPRPSSSSPTAGATRRSTRRASRPTTAPG